MTQIVPFESTTLPANIAKMFGGPGEVNELVGNNPGGGFPTLSIKGKVFHIQRGDERTLVTKPGEDDPAASIEVVVVRANPNRSKVFYAAGYQEGQVGAKPTCYSDDGAAPAPNAQEPQSKRCATCAHNQWGSEVTPSGKKGKACSDSRRLAIAPVGTVKDPMLLRVPPGSIKALEEYGKLLAARGLPPQAVVTRIGFDHAQAYPSLTFKPIGLINDPVLLAEIKDVSMGDLVAQITGMRPADAATEGEQEEAAAAPAPKPEPVAAAPKPAAPKPAPKPAEEPKVATTGLAADIDAMLDGMKFDDDDQ